MGITDKMNNINKKETSRLQIRIPIELKDQLENVVKTNVMGMTNSKSLMVSMALVSLFNQMESSSIDDVYLNDYIPFLNTATSNGDD